MSDNRISIGCATPSFTGLLAILFIGLKLGGIITWSWWWVLSPIWIPLVISILMCVILVLFLLIKYYWYDKFSNS